jgi:hypothetical protein
MSLLGGAPRPFRGHYHRKELDSSDDEPDADDEAWEVPLDDEEEPQSRASRGEQPQPEASTANQRHGKATLVSQTTFEAIRDIFTPSNEVKKRTGELLLKGREQGEYRPYSGIDLDTELLEQAGHLPPSATAFDRVHYAQKLAADACATRCGGECDGTCRVRAFVVTPVYGTDFFFGSHVEIVQSVLTQCATCDVYVWDELEHNSMRKLCRELDSLLETVPGLAMRTTQLKTVAGQVRSLGGPQLISRGVIDVQHLSRRQLPVYPGRPSVLFPSFVRRFSITAT